MKGDVLAGVEIMRLKIFKSDFSNLTDNFSGFPSISATLAETINHAKTCTKVAI